jgi:hypothetical protein
MDGVINKDELFCDKYKAFVLCEYTRELELIKKLIEVAEAGWKNKQWKAHGLLRAFAIRLQKRYWITAKWHTTICCWDISTLRI